MQVAESVVKCADKRINHVEPNAPKKTTAFTSLLASAARFRGKLFVAVVALIIGGALQLLFPYFTQLLIDATRAGLAGEAPVSWRDNIDTIAWVLMGTVVAILICVYIDASLFGEVGERLVARSRKDVFGRLVRLPMGFFGENRVGELSSRLLADLGLLLEFWTNDLRLALRYTLIAVGGVVLMFTTSPKLALAVFSVLPLTIGVGWYFGKRIRGISARTQQGLADSSVVLEESLHGVESVKTFCNEDYERERYGAAVDSSMGHGIRGARARALFIGIILMVMFGAWVFVMWFGSRSIMGGEISEGEFTGFMFYLFFAGSSIGTLAEAFGKFQRALGANTRVAELVAERPEHLGDAGDPCAAIKGGVTFDAVTFAYPMRPDTTVLDGLTLSVEPGQRVALVGPSGAGKSTVVALLFRLFEPVGGRVLVDGKPAADYPLSQLRGQLAIVSQEVILFGGSIRENIGYGRQGASEEEIWDAAEKARMGEFIRSLPEGLETRLGDRGMQLSGGQRQRLAIARAILRDPAILVLDEATSALDSESERLVQEALETLMQGRTSIVIAHRLRTVRDCDQIFVIKSGQVVENGSHETLHSAGGLYRLLCENEFGENG